MNESTLAFLFVAICCAALLLIIGGHSFNSKVAFWIGAGIFTLIVASVMIMVFMSLWDIGHTDKTSSQ